MLRLIELIFINKSFGTCDGLLHSGSQNRSISNRPLERVKIDLMRLSFNSKRVRLYISSKSEFLAYFSIHSLQGRVCICLINLKHLTLVIITDPDLGSILV